MSVKGKLEALMVEAEGAGWRQTANKELVAWVDGPLIEAFRAAVLEEREACAKLVEKMLEDPGFGIQTPGFQPSPTLGARQVATAIRSRRDP